MRFLKILNKKSWIVRKDLSPFPKN